MVNLLPEASPKVQKEALEKVIGHMEKAGPETYAGQRKEGWMDYLQNQLKEVNKTLGKETIPPETAKDLGSALNKATSGTVQASPGTFGEAMLNAGATGQPTKALEVAAQAMQTTQSEQLDQIIKKQDEMQTKLKVLVGMTAGLALVVGFKK